VVYQLLRKSGKVEEWGRGRGEEGKSGDGKNLPSSFFRTSVTQSVAELPSSFFRTSVTESVAELPS